MNTLTISQLFSNFKLYQDQYLSILDDPERYYTPVADAYVQIWPAAPQQLFLGDLLQLWLGDKWVVNTEKAPLINSVFRAKADLKPQFNRFVFAIEGNLLTGQNKANAWLNDAAQSELTSVNSLFQFYCIWKSLNRPQVKLDTLQRVV
ncbi:hypothetical protein [Acinetobacter tianfuensis]|uniref:Uncharacterized protein n=1 Tax=Acinetobacter tianfuensis TaxID=2419603 RepID=A0A3A8F210_9GAMM|nr:hypothetical protein [Acinetobacter tianfuensis]RKG34723.1 hypothetical protein D7V32_01310 [Acinetobacter tianfuensis]